MKINKEIIELIAPCKDYLWGGNRLREEYNKISDKKIIAESWELSAIKNSSSIIANGDWKGKTLREYVDFGGKDVVGTNCKGDFPILIKLIDAKNDLSIQVHPSDEYALKNENSYGKTEMWYIIDCEECSHIVYGFKKDMTKEEFKKRIEDNTFVSSLNVIDVKPGDAYLIPSGTLHAIGRGILIAEIQENSDITYRVYDYDRCDADGNKRPLHVEKALEVVNMKPLQEKKSDFKDNIIFDCKYFSVYMIKENKTLFSDEKSFRHLLILNGNGTIESKTQKFEIKKGKSYFIPASYGEYSVKGKNLEIIFTEYNG